MDAPQETEQAMNSALAAEGAAEESVRRCAAQAAEMLARAREEARRIAARTDQRISRLHASCGENNLQRVRKLQSEKDQASYGWSPAEQHDAMMEAISRVAARLTGEDSGSP